MEDVTKLEKELGIICKSVKGKVKLDTLKLFGNLCPSNKKEDLFNLIVELYSFSKKAISVMKVTSADNPGTGGATDVPALVRKELTDILPGLLKQALEDFKSVPADGPEMKKTSDQPSERHTIILEKQGAAERAWRKGKGSHEAYVKLRNSFCWLESEKRRSYNTKALLASAGDTKALHKKVNKLIGESTQMLPSTKDTQKLSEDFKDFFADKVNNIRSNIEEEGRHINEETIGDPEDVYVQFFSFTTEMRIRWVQTMFAQLTPGLYPHCIGPV